MSEQQQKEEISLALEQIKGLGDTTISKLNALGYYSARDLAVGRNPDIRRHTKVNRLGVQSLYCGCEGNCE